MYVKGLQVSLIRDLARITISRRLLPREAVGERPIC